MTTKSKLAVPLWSRALHTKSHTMHVSEDLNGLRIQINNDKDGTCTSFYMKGAGVAELTHFLNEVRDAARERSEIAAGHYYDC
jgi:hypothetical protein